MITDGAVAMRGTEIVAVGKADDAARRVRRAATVVDGRRFVVTPGMVNTHIHITGEPLTRGFVPDDTPFEENVFAVARARCTPSTPRRTSGCRRSWRRPRC